MSFPAYPEYKDSGVPWLGEVPGHWELSRIGSRFSERREKVSDTEYPPLSVTKNGIVPQLDTAAKTDDNDNRKCVLAGDFVINSRSDRKGSSGLSTLDGSVSLINTVISPDNTMIGAFVHHLFRSVAFQEEYYRYGKGIVADLWSTNYGEMKAITLAVPPMPEQEAIATFLDRETAKIDALVAEQKRLIALLKEKRQAVISHAVTKGLNPDARMKDSGIEWLGEIPAHWELVQQRRLINRIEQGWSPQAHDRMPEPGEFSVLRLSAIRSGNFRPDERKALPELAQGELAALPIIAEGDFLLTRANTPELVGDCAIAKDVENTIFSDLIYRLTFAARLHKRFALFAMLGASTRMQVQCDARGTSMTMAKISHGHIKAWWLALPPVDEQIEIADFLEAQESRLAATVDSASQAIRFLIERRAALISAAVTGKIDVRGLVDQQELEAA